MVRTSTGAPVAVHYAAHNHVVDVPWATLQAAAAPGGPLARLAATEDLAHHPPVFIARGTHAAYPLPCRQDSCDNGTPFEDNQHDGSHRWPERSCSASCVTGFPVQADGTSAAGWNAFDGHWGSAICIAGSYWRTLGRAARPGEPGALPAPLVLRLRGHRRPAQRPGPLRARPRAPRRPAAVTPPSPGRRSRRAAR